MPSRLEVYSSGLVVCLFLAACGASPSQSGSTPVAAAESATEGRETIQMALPNGWILAHRDASPEALIAEFVPPGEDAQTWTQMLTYQRFAPSRSSAAFLQTLSQLLGQACPQGRWAPVPGVEQNGYSVALAWYECQLNPATNLGEFTHFKVVEGRDALYVWQLARRVPPYVGARPPLSADDVTTMARGLSLQTVCMEGVTGARACHE